jgi:pantoate--beta-alanine ligase
MIEQLNSPQAARLWCQRMRAQGRSIGFVPTMGALHDGHLSLVQQALEENDVACVSVFVNPLQFDEGADLQAYPRDWEGDVARLAGVGCQMVFRGELAMFFPDELDSAGQFPPQNLKDPGPGALGLEGATRDGHFEGVATIVDRLFEVLEPNRAYFGQKDFQQTLVVRYLARDGNGPQVVVCPIAREASGLAMSSRNERLTPEDRSRAVFLSQALSHCASAWQAGERSPAVLEGLLQKAIKASGAQYDYAAVRDPEAWTVELPEGPLAQAVAVVAARVGPVRLLDNHLLQTPFPLPGQSNGDRGTRS